MDSRFKIGLSSVSFPLSLETSLAKAGTVFELVDTCVVAGSIVS